MLIERADHDEDAFAPLLQRLSDVLEGTPLQGGVHLDLRIILCRDAAPVAGLRWVCYLRNLVHLLVVNLQANSPPREHKLAEGHDQPTQRYTPLTLLVRRRYLREF